MKIKPYRWYFRLPDLFLAPIMWAFSGFAFELPQESHKWHNKILSPEEVSILDVSRMLLVDGTDSSRWTHGSYGMLHLPLLGGWRDYIILEVEGDPKYWHVGWLSGLNSGMVQRLPIYGKRIKMFRGLKGDGVRFFAIDNLGNQILLRKVDEGRLGDSRHRTVRLF